MKHQPLFLSKIQVYLLSIPVSYFHLIMQEEIKTNCFIFHGREISIDLPIDVVDVHVIPRIHILNEPLTQIITNDSEYVDLISIKVCCHRTNDRSIQTNGLIIDIGFDTSNLHHHKRTVIDCTSFT